MLLFFLSKLVVFFKLMIVLSEVCLFCNTSINFCIFNIVGISSLFFLNKLLFNLFSSFISFAFISLLLDINLELEFLKLVIDNLRLLLLLLILILGGFTKELNFKLLSFFILL